MSGAPVLDILREMHGDTYRNAAPLPKQEDDQPVWRGLGFQLAGTRLVSVIGEVVEIINPPRVTTLPRVKAWMLGVANVRGRLVPIVDLAAYLALPTTTPRRDWKVMIVEDDELVVGLLVEQSLGMQQFVEESFEDVVLDGLDALQPYMRGAFRLGGRVFHVVSLRSLVRGPRFFEVAELVAQ
ncbi:MAG: chemotaxis protein CheW [Pseudomonadota bacterium]